VIYFGKNVFGKMFSGKSHFSMYVKNSFVKNTYIACLFRIMEYQFLSKMFSTLFLSAKLLLYFFLFTLNADKLFWLGWQSLAESFDGAHLLQSFYLHLFPPSPWPK